MPCWQYNNLERLEEIENGGCEPYSQNNVDLLLQPFAYLTEVGVVSDCGVVYRKPSVNKTVRLLPST